MNTLTCGDSLNFLKTKEDLSIDINYSDVPYALGSEVIIKKDGMVDYSKASDFMSKWEMPTGKYWREWFDESYRSLKHGGYCIMFGIDRQLLLFKYYAALAGFKERQSLYWYFISNFPKASNLSIMLDNNAKVKRTVIGTKEVTGEEGTTGGYKNGVASIDGADVSTKRLVNITESSTEVAKKYDGYRYSISPLKQTNETIMIFQKPYLTGSCLHDILEKETGDETIACGALNIDENRVPCENKTEFPVGQYGLTNFRPTIRTEDKNKDSRYPSQTFIDSKCAEELDKQSGIKKTTPRLETDGSKVDTRGQGWGFKRTSHNISDDGGISRILHKCDFEDEEHELYFYEPKVSGKERNAGCDDFNEVQANNWNPSGIGQRRIEAGLGFKKNFHPTLKPIKLNERILKLFKSPDKQVIIYPFAGSGSEIMGGVKAGFTNWSGCELNEEYCQIAQARIKHWTDQDIDIIKEIKTEKEFRGEIQKIIKEVNNNVEKKTVPQQCQSIDRCTCGGLIVKYKHGRCCESCLTDYK